jgi:hypothetical protein
MSGGDEYVPQLLDKALKRGQMIQHVIAMQDSAIVITDGMVPVSQNDHDHRAAEDPASIQRTVDGGSGVSFCSPEDLK